MAETDAETVRVTLEAEDGTDELTLPVALVEMLQEENETVPQVVGDIAMFGFAQRVHGAVHHSEGDPSGELAAIEESTMALFEERFGATFGELTGHDH